jgi:hypothetical protein
MGSDVGARTGVESPGFAGVAPAQANISMRASVVPIMLAVFFVWVIESFLPKVVSARYI